MKKPVALVTGASSGIGRESALILAQKGYDLVLVARRIDKLSELKSIIESGTASKVQIIEKDLSRNLAAEEIFKELNEQDLTVELLINNAGFGLFGEFAETEWAKEKMMIDLNITSLVHLTKLFLPSMISAGKGKILNVASTAAFQPGPLMSVYYASKAFVLSFSEAIAEEVASKGVTVTALCPGPTSSEFQQVASMKDSKLFADKKIPDSREVAMYGIEALMKGQRVAIHGKMNYIMANAVRFTPRNFVTRIVKFMQAKKS